MTDFNTSMSNGTCYYKAGSKTGSNFIPCGNEAASHIACCGVYDNCLSLSSNACYNNTFGTTYIVGCTDPTYQDPTCPNKDQWSDNVWAGLILYNSNGPEWIACEDTETTLTRGSASGCTTLGASPTIAFSAAPIIPVEARLPSAISGSISWVPGYAQATAVSTTATISALLPQPSSTTSSSPQTSTTTLTSTTSSISPSPSPSATTTILSIGALAGIVLGSLSAFLLLSALIFYVLRRRRRHLAVIPAIEDQIRRRSTNLEKDNDRDLRSPGHRSELSADDIISPVSGEFGGTNRTSGGRDAGGSVSGAGSGIGEITRNTSPLLYHHYQQSQEARQQHLQRQRQRQGLSQGAHELPIDPPRQGFYEMPG